MRNLLAAFFTSATLLAGGVFAQSQPANKAPQQDANSQRARQVIDRCIQALGGDAYLKLFDMKQQARGYGFNRGEASGVGVPFTRYYQFPDKERVEFFKQHDWVLIYNGREAAEVTFRGPQALEKQDLEDYLRRRDHSLEVVLRGWGHNDAATTAFFFEGETIEETKEVFAISLVNKNNDAVTLYIDRKTYLPVKKIYSWRDPQDKQKNEESETFDKYRMVQGIATPFLYTRTRNGLMTAQRFLTSVAYNVGVGDRMFDVPAIPAKKAGR